MRPKKQKQKQRSLLLWSLCLSLRDGQASQRCFPLPYCPALWTSAREPERPDNAIEHVTGVQLVKMKRRVDSEGPGSA